MTKQIHQLELENERLKNNSTIIEPQDKKCAMKSFLAKVWKLLNMPKGVQLFFMRFFKINFLVGVTGIIFNDKKKSYFLSIRIDNTLGAYLEVI